jgi:hypothetical protein
MPATLLTGVRICMEIYLPKLFELHTQPDIVKITTWYVSQGSVVQPGDDLIEVWAPGRRITIPTPPELTTPHRVVQLTQDKELHLGDFLIKLEPIAPSTSD